jgi:glycosyltransferase involved in cell wall biosynthesis
MEKAVYLQAKHLQARGVDTVLLTRPATCNGGVFPGEVVKVPYPERFGLVHGRVLDRTVNYPTFAERLGEVVAAMVHEGRVDVVDAQGIAGLGYGRRRRRDASLRAPLVVNPQGMEEHKTTGVKRLALARVRALSRAAARLADRVVATDEATRAEVPRYLGVDPARVVVLPNGIDADEIRDLTPPEPGRRVHDAFPALADASPVLLSVGRVEAYKGLADVAAAVSRLARDGALPPRWAWVVVGSGPAAGSLVRGLPGAVATRVHLAGRIPDGLLHALYERADVFVHATRYEGSSLVTLEAMAHGRPVVATAAGGIPDKVVDGVTGRLVPPADIAALAGAIRDVLADPERRRRMGERGRAHVLARFAWPVLVERTIAVYEELLLEARR